MLYNLIGSYYCEGSRVLIVDRLLPNHEIER